MTIAFNPLQLQNVFDAAGYQLDEAGEFGPSGVLYRLVDPAGMRGSLVVTQADGMETDGVIEPWDGEWIHTSVAFTDRDPTYAELVMLHKGVFGRRRFSFQVFAPESKHVTIHDHALHLWGKADGSNPLPDFGVFGSI